MLISNFPYFSCNICLTAFPDVRIVRLFSASAAYFDGLVQFLFRNSLTKRNGVL